jgi:hypothetical protein
VSELKQCTHAGVVSRDECPYCKPAPKQDALTVMESLRAAHANGYVLQLSPAHVAALISLVDRAAQQPAPDAEPSDAEMMAEAQRLQQFAIKGVHRRADGKYRVQIAINGRRQEIPATFNTAEEAAGALARFESEVAKVFESFSIRHKPDVEDGQLSDVGMDAGSTAL